MAYGQIRLWHLKGAIVEKQLMWPSCNVHIVRSRQQPTVVGTPTLEIYWVYMVAGVTPLLFSQVL